MNLECPKCSEWFELSSKCFNEQRFNLSEYLVCSKCGYMLPSLEFVGVVRWSEFIDWINAYNEGLIKKKQKSIWDVLVYDRELRKQLVRENILTACSSDPSIRFLMKCIEPDKLFILKRFKEYTSQHFKHGYINPIMRFHRTLALPHESVVEL